MQPLHLSPKIKLSQIVKEKRRQNSCTRYFPFTKYPRTAVFNYFMLAEAFGYDPGMVKPVPTDPDVLASHVNVRIPFRIRASSLMA